MFEKIKAFFKNIWQKILNFPRFMKEAFISWWNDICPKKEKSSNTENANYQYGNSQNSWNASNTGNSYYQNTNTSYNNTAGNTQSTENKKETSKPQKAASPLAHAFDIVASLCFLFAFIIVLKPKLINDDNDIKIIFYIGLSFFTLFKLAAIFTSHSPIKIVSVLILALSVLTCFIAKEYFILFLTFIVLLYFAFEFSCSFKAKAILRKTFFLVFLFCVEYFAIHYVFIEDLQIKMKDVFNILF